MAPIPRRKPVAWIPDFRTILINVPWICIRPLKALWMWWMVTGSLDGADGPWGSFHGNTPTGTAPDPWPEPHQVVHRPGCDPEAAPLCANLTGLLYCMDDPEFPALDLSEAVAAEDPLLFNRKYSDVFRQSGKDLVEGIGKYQEEHFSYSYYTGASGGRSPYDVSHWVGPEGYLCPADVKYANPQRARNVNGQWRVVVNLGPGLTQTLRIETCLTPGSACRLLAPCFGSKCAQVFAYHRMLAFDPCDPHRGLFVDVFRFPAACSCHVPRQS